MSAPRLVQAFQDAQLHGFPQATFLPYLHYVAAPVLVFEQAAHLADGVMRAVVGPCSRSWLANPHCGRRHGAMVLEPIFFFSIQHEKSYLTC